MVMVAIAAISFWAERTWRRRAFYLEQAAQHASMETHYADVALDLAGAPRQPPSQIVHALLPDASGVEFATQGLVPRIYYPLGSKNLADQATVTRLISMCREEAAREGAIRRMFERNAARPWLRLKPTPFSD